MAAISTDLIAPPGLKTQLENLATTMTKPKGTALFRRGDDALGAFLIRSGKVALGLDCPSSIFPSRVFGRGSVVGLPATVSGNPYSLTAEVVEDAELGFIPRATVMESLRRHPQLCFEVMEILSNEISEFRSALKQVDLRSVPRATQ